MTATIEAKRCSACREEKPLDEFRLRNDPSRKPDARYSECRSCQRAAKREWAERNPSDVSRARRRHAEENRGTEVGNCRRQRARFPEKARARRAVECAVRTGGLVRPDKCEGCGGEGRTYRDGRASIQAHHPDYSKPLEVEWLCEDCHNESPVG